MATGKHLIQALSFVYTLQHPTGKRIIKTCMFSIFTFFQTVSKVLYLEYIHNHKIINSQS